MFVRPYLTSSSAAWRLILPKTNNKKNTEKQNKPKKKKKTWKINITPFGFLDFSLIVTLLESRRIFFSLRLIFSLCLQAVAVFHFASSELTPLFHLGDLTEHYWLAAVNLVSTVWCIWFLSALAQTCGPFLHFLLISCLFIKQNKKKQQKKFL